MNFVLKIHSGIKLLDNVELGYADLSRMTSIASKTGAKNRGSDLLRKISVVPMITATYFMVAGGPYGLEDIVQKTGYVATLLILVITPLLWGLPTALIVSAVPLQRLAVHCAGRRSIPP